MDKDISNIVENLLKVRPILADIVRGLNEGDPDAISQLNPYFPESRQRELFVWNAHHMRNSFRNNDGSGERPYYVHPASAAILYSAVVSPKNQTDRKAIDYILTHDLLDEALGYQGRKLLMLRTKNPEYQEEIDASVLLCAPDERTLQAYGLGDNLLSSKIAPVLNVLKQGNSAHAHSLLFDKVDNLLDLGYLKGQPRENERAARWFVAHTLFVTDMLSVLLSRGAQYFAENVANKVAKERGITQLAKEHLRGYWEFQSKNNTAIHLANEAHLRMYDAFPFKV